MCAAPGASGHLTAQPTLLTTRTPSVAVHSHTDLIQALATGSFSDVLDTPEDNWLDFKEAPYPIDDRGRLTDKGKWELAKDVAAFANIPSGGYIVLGYRTERHENEAVESAVELRLIRKAVVDVSSYQDVIDQWVYPRVRRVTIRWFPPAKELDDGVLVIEVPGQDDYDLPFLVRRVFDENTDRVHDRGHFAIPIREGARSELSTAEAVHRLLSGGRQAGRAPRIQPVERDNTARAERRVAEAEDLLGWSDLPTYALQALPPESGPDILPGFFDRDGLWLSLYRPTSLRPMGFNLETGGEPEPVENGLRTARPSHHLLWLDTDGFFTAVGIADPEFLGWAINQTDGAKMRINALTLVEYTLEFFSFVERELVPRLARTDPWDFVVTCHRFKTAGVVLRPGQAPKDRVVGSLMRSASAATSDNWRKDFTGTHDAGENAFVALKYFYALFSLGEDAIPYCDGQRISEERILESIRT